LDSVSADGATQISFRKPIVPIPNYDKRDWKELMKVKLILADDAVFPVNSVEKFSVLSISSQSMSLQVDFTYPKMISTALKDYDSLEIEFLKEEIFVSTETLGQLSPDTVLRKAILPFVTEAEVATIASFSAAANSTSAAVGGLAAATVGLNVFFAGSMQLLWGLVNTLQILTHLPLFSVTFPSTTLFLYQIIIDIANFELYDSNKLMNRIFTEEFF